MTFWRRTRRDAAPLPDIGTDRRVYAIGDVHGCAGLLDQLLAMIGQDDGDRDRKPISLILLGDLIDRGPNSRGVVERAMALMASGGDVHCLKGNHEEVFVLAARGDGRALPVFRRMEGETTLASYGLDPALFRVMTDQEIADWMERHVPRSHVDFLDALPDSIAIGDYLFVHAGIRPDVPIEAQNAADLRWIRREFLEHRGRHPHMVIHGHSISPDVEERAERIGIDTGAFLSGRLTAIGLEGTDRWILQTGG
ncbi:serine/threonine protein phosphatase [Sphingobium sp. Leaf26]|uniref:metallophosphoesterase family protein n=1 Tax=Sphingobium sp. Leaf26 TaxID=1735693 RepID=UPI0006F35F7B|nr:metallophosphoesterase family protein [Sphingobium sp. Leaf26]KQN09619.1 serine/threonine protein phosphatase [Sphingobium sp. Leaf26]